MNIVQRSFVAVLIGFAFLAAAELRGESRLAFRTTDGTFVGIEQGELK